MMMSRLIWSLVLSGIFTSFVLGHCHTDENDIKKEHHNPDAAALSHIFDLFGPKSSGDKHKEHKPVGKLPTNTKLGGSTKSFADKIMDKSIDSVINHFLSAGTRRNPQPSKYANREPYWHHNENKGHIDYKHEFLTKRQNFEQVRDDKTANGYFEGNTFNFHFTFGNNDSPSCCEPLSLEKKRERVLIDNYNLLEQIIIEPVHKKSITRRNCAEDDLAYVKRFYKRKPNSRTKYQDCEVVETCGWVPAHLLYENW